jgi:hypothetical protein
MRFKFYDIHTMNMQMKNSPDTGIFKNALQGGAMTARLVSGFSFLRDGGVPFPLLDPYEL